MSFPLAKPRRIHSNERPLCPENRTSPPLAVNGSKLPTLASAAY